MATMYDNGQHRRPALVRAGSLTIGALLVLGGAAVKAPAQVASPVGMTRTTVNAPLLDQVTPNSTIRWQLQPATTEHKPLWPWLVGGTLIGAGIGAAVGAAQVARSDDAFFPQLAVIYGGGIGAVAGLVGGFLVGAIVTTPEQER